MSGKKISAATANNPAAKAPAKKATPAAKPAAAKTTGSKKASKSFRSTHAHLFAKAPRDFGIGRALPPKRDLSRVVRWPAYVRLQRQRAILKKRLKVPPSIAQFTRTLDKSQAANLFRLLSHYRPESKKEKATRLKAKAEAQLKSEKGEKKAEDPKATTKPIFVKYGLNHITALVESKKAKLVVIAHDVDPIELVVWLPSLCRKMNVPYVIVKGKARLGHIVHKKTASVLALTEVRKEDAAKLEQFIANVRVHFNDDVAGKKKWGGQVLGFKAQQVIRKRAAAATKEVVKA